MDNLLRDLPDASSDERFDTVCEHGGVRIERIVSAGQATPPGVWLTGEDDEWVVVLAGSAGLTVDGEDGEFRLGPGDFRLIPAGVRHRVEWTRADVPTVWLAVHLGRAKMGSSTAS